jgi:hypothetical protein
VTGDEPAVGTINLSKEPDPARPGPAWIIVPARIVALIIVLPLRLVHDLFVAIGRGLRAGWQRLMRAPGRLARFARRILAPLGRLAATIGHGIGALFDLVVIRPLRWLGAVVILGLLRQFGALLDLLIVRPLRWLGAVVILGLLRQLGALLDLVVVRPLRWLGVVVFLRGSGRLGRWLYRVLIVPFGRLLEFVLLRPLRALGRGLAWLLSATRRGIGLLIGVLVVMPAVLLWRYVLWPPLLGLAWLGRRTLAVLAAGLRAFVAGLVWSWRLLGRCLGWLGRVLFVLPAQALWRYVLAPAVAGIAVVWRTLVVAPARWVRMSVLRPFGSRVRGMWRVSVREPLSAARRTMRQASRDVRLTLRRTFRGR